MEVDEEPRDSTDPVGNASPVPDPETESEKAHVAEEDAPPNPDGACCPTIMLPERGPVRPKRARKMVPTVSTLVKPELRRNLFP